MNSTVYIIKDSFLNSIIADYALKDWKKNSIILQMVKTILHKVAQYN